MTSDRVARITSLRKQGLSIREAVSVTTDATDLRAQLAKGANTRAGSMILAARKGRS